MQDKVTDNALIYAYVHRYLVCDTDENVCTILSSLQKLMHVPYWRL